MASSLNFKSAIYIDNNRAFFPHNSKIIQVATVPLIRDTTYLSANDIAFFVCNKFVTV